MYILANGRLITRDGALPYLPDGGVAIDGSRIAAVGTTAELREKYQVMSVPCLVINENQIYFGKKNVGQLLEILEKPVV